MRGALPVVSVVWLGLLAAGCNKEEKVLPGVLAVDTELLDFGTIALGESSSLDVTLSNSGGTAIDVLSVTLIDGDDDVYTLSRAGDTVEPGASLAITVTFTPEDQDVESGQVQIRTTDTELDNILVVLRAIGGLSNADDDSDGFTVGEGDCDDYNDTVYPGADEGCDGRDSDCDGTRPADEADYDGDSYLVCEGDCDDGNNLTYPGASEICDGNDNDCDGSANENVDDDGDGLTICQGDCDDDEATAFPGNPEVCEDGIDNDCVDGIDVIDADGDGHSVCSNTGDCDDNDATAFPIVVATTGNSGAAGTDLDPVDSIATALTRLDSTCRLVVLEAGTYFNVDSDWTGGRVEIAGRTGTADDVVLTAAAYSRHLTITGGEVTLRDLALEGGNAAEDGGAVQVANASLDLSNVRARNNQSALDGGAISVLSGTLDLRRGCRFEDNSAGEDGGAVQVDAATFSDRGTRWTSNEALAGQGGALSINGGTVSVEGAEFRGNTAAEGGGIAILNTGSYEFEGNTVSLNLATDGAGISLRDVSDPNGFIRNTAFQDNAASGVGGGVAFVGFTGAIEVANNTFTGNDSAGDGAAIAVSIAGSGPQIALQNNIANDNDGPSGIFVAPGAGATVLYNTAFLQNSGIDFGGEVGDGNGDPLDGTNAVRNPSLGSFTDDGNPDNDDLTLGGGSSEVDSGNPDSRFDDTDGSQNDRGLDGGPGGS